MTENIDLILKTIASIHKFTEKTIKDNNKIR